jgi:hypothetical protein
MAMEFKTGPHAQIQVPVPVQVPVHMQVQAHVQI